MVDMQAHPIVAVIEDEALLFKAPHCNNRSLSRHKPARYSFLSCMDPKHCSSSI